jgi:hypothetical protein
MNALDRFLGHSTCDLIPVPRNIVQPYRWYLTVPVHVLLQISLSSIGYTHTQEDIDRLYNKYEEQFLAHGYYDFDTIHICYYDNKFYMIKGQHRYQIISSLYWQRKLSDFEDVHVKCYCVYSKDELEDTWVEVNGSRQSSQ